jgi:hypothetical protein
MMNATATAPTKSGKVTLGSVEPGEYVTAHGYTDAYAYFVVGATATTLKLKRATVTLDPNWKREFIPGGFCGHTVNNGGEWIVEPPAEDTPTVVAHYRPKRGAYFLDGKALTYGAREYYDFNF